MSEKMFPIIPTPMLGYIHEEVPWAIVQLHEKQALKNHDQSVEVLARRGGLAWPELYAILTDRSWDKMLKDVKAEEGGSIAHSWYRLQCQKLVESWKRTEEKKKEEA